MPKVWIVSAIAILALTFYLIFGFSTSLIPQLFSQFRTTAPSLDAFLVAGNLAQGEQEFRQWLQVRPNDDKARFSLATIQLVRSGERLSQALYRYGLKLDRANFLFPLFNLPIPVNPQPQQITYSDLDQLLQNLNADLEQVRQTLAMIKDQQVKLPLQLGLIKMDLDGDGKFAEKEVLWQVFRAVTGNRVTPQQAQNFLITFDYGDVLWLRGYTHIFSGLLNVLLSCDRREIFSRTAHLFFAKPDTPHSFLLTHEDNLSDARVIDFFAALHLLRFPITQPAKMASAMQNFQATLTLSRASWQAILAETDDDREWLPNPKQKAIFPDIRISQEMIDSWISATQEGEELLAGRKLVPFWRTDPQGRGINLKRVFTAPQTLDLILWVQGTAATPYLERGRLTDQRVWDQLLRVFGGDLLAFGWWFN